MKWLGLLLLFWLPFSFAAGQDIYAFNSPALAQRYDHLISELRCLVCQNEDLGSSNAPLAADLRQQIYNMINSDQSDAEIKNYLVNRYGNFVLYRPPLQMNTIMLWVGPLVLLAIGFTILIYFVRKQSMQNP